MGKYLKIFKTLNDYNNFISTQSSNVPVISLVQENKNVFFGMVRHSMMQHNELCKSLNYIKFTAIDNSSISLNSHEPINIKYSFDCKTWIDWDLQPILLNSGDSVYMKGNNQQGFNSSAKIDADRYNQFVILGKTQCSGNIMSLLYEDDFENKYNIDIEYCFANVFKNCEDLVTAPELPATKISAGCYYAMFNNCTSLEKTPDLPATQLESSCYSCMFNNCTSLLETPILPATVVSVGCYLAMFMNCTNITTVNDIFASYLEIGTCMNMFNGCKNLNKITMWATNIYENDCLETWVSNVSPTGKFVKYKDTNFEIGVNGIPKGWEIENI